MPRRGRPLDAVPAFDAAGHGASADLAHAVRLDLDPDARRRLAGVRSLGRPAAGVLIQIASLVGWLVLVRGFRPIQADAMFWIVQGGSIPLLDPSLTPTRAFATALATGLAVATIQGRSAGAAPRRRGATSAPWRGPGRPRNSRDGGATAPGPDRGAKPERRIRRIVKSAQRVRRTCRDGGSSILRVLGNSDRRWETPGSPRPPPRARGPASARPGSEHGRQVARGRDPDHSRIDDRSHIQMATNSYQDRA